MNDPKAAAAYHPGDAPVTRPDLDALIAEARRDAEGKGGARASLIRRLADALAAERARADQAEQRIADAPHGDECAVEDEDPASTRSDRCDCWKSAAPAAEHP